MLSEVYQKILSFLGPSSAAGTANSSLTFPGLFELAGSGVSNPNAIPAITSLGGMGTNAFAGIDRRSAGLSPMLVEVVLKIDGKLKVHFHSRHDVLSKD